MGSTSMGDRPASAQTTTVIHRARAVHTLDPARPTGQAVAVRDGRILGVGSVDELAVHGAHRVDDTFADHVLLPGFVEAHAHSFEGALWQFLYCGWFDRTGPDGRHWPGCRDIAAVLQRLREAAAELADPAAPLCAWGLDPIYFAGERLVASHLDRVSTTRPIFVAHASLHLATVNTACMTAAGIDADTLVEGIARDADGRPNGELQELAAMSLAGEPFRALFRSTREDRSIVDFGRLARNAGITTVTDLGSTSVADDAVVARWHRIVDDPAFPTRVSLFHNPGFGATTDFADDAAMVVARRAESTDKLRLGHVKFVLDGSIQGFTARLNPPGYLGDRPNGIWLFPPEQVEPRLRAFHDAGLTVHCHCNGDEAVDVFLDAIEAVLTTSPRPDHRHTVQHCQLTTEAQYRRIASLGACANLFANHTYYWGDQHRDLTVGPDRASRMNAAATALRHGVPLSLHCDAAVTPLGSLHVAWAAVDRRTATGQVLGAEERIPVWDALRAVTIGAAYQLKMDHEVGTIAPGKRADFAVLADDPFAVDPAALRDIEVAGTVLAGTWSPAA